MIRFIRGPIFANILLADEINRTPPKTQAALLEAMQEYQVTVSGARFHLDRPLFVLATQNPIEQEGTYPLPEAQLDRFMFNVVIDYPSAEEERRILAQTTGNLDPPIAVVATGEEIERLHAVVRDVPAAENVIDYAARLVRATRPVPAGRGQSPDFVRKWVRWGAGPRAGPGAAARRQGARAARRPQRGGARRHPRGGAAGAAPPRAAELPGRGGRGRRRRDRPAAARADPVSGMTGDARSPRAVGDRGSRAGGACHRRRHRRRPAPQPVPRLQRRVQPVPPLPPRRRSEVRRLEAVRAHRSLLHEAVPRDDEPRRAAGPRCERVDGVRRSQRRHRSSSTRGCWPPRCRTCCSGRATASGWSCTTRRSGSSSAAAAAGRTCAACSWRCRSSRRPAGPSAAAPLKRAAELLKRRGLICVFSDLYDDDDALDAELRRAVRMGHEVAVFHVLDARRAGAAAPGEVEIEDLESGATLIARPADARRSYRARIDEFLDTGAVAAPATASTTRSR